MNTSRHVWEGWTVQAFINELEMIFDMIMANKSHVKPFKTKAEIKEWCRENQPGYKKHIPEVVKHFQKRAGL